MNLKSLFPKRDLTKRLTIKREKMLIIYSIAAIFTLSVGTRLLSAQYGYYLNEFDTYWHYLQTLNIVQSIDQKGFSGLFNYFHLTDTMSWYPEGRNVAATSFGGLYYIGALSYITLRNIFGMNISLYDYLVLLPVVVGGFISIAVYLLGRKIDGEAVGIFAGIITAISPPLISRDSFGWWKTEPFAYLFGVLALLLFISLAEEDRVNLKSIASSSIAGILLGLGTTIWGGTDYFIGTVGLAIFVALFFIKSYKALFENVTVLVVWSLVISMMFQKPGFTVLISPANFVIYGGLLSCLILIVRQKFTPLVTIRDKIYSILLSALFGVALAALGAVGGLSQRYLTVIFPTLTTSTSSVGELVSSVAEQTSSTVVEYFAYFSIILFISGFSVYYILKKGEFKKIAALMFAATAIYFAASFGRLEIYMSFAFPILGGIGILAILRALLVQPTQLSTKKRASKGPSNTSLEIVFVIFIITVLLWSGIIWVSYANQPVSIATGSVATTTTSSSWLNTLTYIRENTPQDAVIISWWDYGYWIRVVGNRTTLIDNATLNATKIALVGQMYMSNETEAIKLIKELVPNRTSIYVVVYAVTYQELEQGLYLIGGGGDESKYVWMAKIALLNSSLYLDPTTGDPTNYFWANTTLGYLYPFTPEQVQYGTQVITAFAYGQKVNKDPYFTLVYNSTFTSYDQVLLYKVNLQG
ncbi:MAG: STT3 domain-containing protein [Nitrososphaeria archaeon]|jgi:dolichyl-diphosphooligosaccharide--protein glycosyltransferase